MKSISIGLLEVLAIVLVPVVGELYRRYRARNKDLNEMRNELNRLSRTMYGDEQDPNRPGVVGRINTMDEDEDED